MNDREQLEIEDRRTFLKTCGRFAVVTPPAMTMLLSTSLTSDAIAKSGHPNNGRGNGGGDGSQMARTTNIASNTRKGTRRQLLHAYQRNCVLNGPKAQRRAGNGDARRWASVKC